MQKFHIWTSTNSAVIARIIGLFLLLNLWIIGDSNEAGAVLLLLLIIMSLIRWRFNIPKWILLIDQIACLLTIYFWEDAAFGLSIPLFESILVGNIWLALPGLIYIIVFDLFSFPLLIALIQAAFVGKIIYNWSLDIDVYQKELDRQRYSRYELEDLKGELLIANSKVARMAELSERNRIAQDLHDNVGHELTAALLALQAFEQLWKEEDPLAGDMLIQSKERLDNSATQLRDTVYNMKPLEIIGINRLEEICTRYSSLEVEFNVFGDSSMIPVYLWNILEPCLKEALTNVSRHSQATKVVVTIDINPYIVRLSVLDNGVVSRKKDIGVGIRNLRQRAQAVGGNISAHFTDKGFHLICVLPIKKEEVNR